LFALKRLKLDSEREGFPITALREIQILKSLDHPNIVKLEEVIIEGKHSSFGSADLPLPNSPPTSAHHHHQFSCSMAENMNVYLVFEFVPHDLMGLIDACPFFNLAQVKCILKQLLEGLSYMHERGFIHRDIKGGNVLVSSSGILKYCDFGLARHVGKQRRGMLTSKVVTRWYRAPELLLGDSAYTSKIDVWSVGCIFAELLTAGSPPFKGQDDGQTLMLIASRCPFPKVAEWKELSNLPNYKAFSPYLYLRTAKNSQHSPQ